MTLPTHTNAVVAHAAGDLRVETVPLDVPGPSDVVVQVAYGGICGSDLHYWQHGAAGESILKAPMRLGHEVVGTVVRAAADGSGCAVGTLVAVHPATPGKGDGSAYPLDRPNLSPGCTYLGSAARFPHTEGVFARHIVVPATMLRPLPTGLSLRDAALAEPASVAWHAVSRAGDVAGKRVLVVGAGPIGLLIVAVLARAGAAEITVTDMHDLPLATAGRVGAGTTLRATDADAIASVQADICFESSGSARGLASAVHGARRGGRVVMVGLLPSGEQPALISLAITRELELVGSFRFNGEMDLVLEALADGTLGVEGIVTHEFAAADGLEAFDVARDSSRSGKVLLLF
ncbi:zinc-binding alcohol dehydrogenase [Cryobacterium roopkundense]|uniref:Threonine dehydrogenase-like Zn-dependent dehydrogenase n=1 Tax=Cryobacterium roopkundense TaxID=1001240 RepID=A0A099JQD3_9MICO|nr:L-idonate 5-dehydrogenase [Cryobacterium roopkundense]KGJ80391.1 zinc-binding alcohol dehydrogenase [Cryobacterium roopkundense]MBB5642033.1 threonine dehydrogenase-like Zn-dependent dehydrogenase [Cryobacterium roopkundense]